MPDLLAGKIGARDDRLAGRFALPRSRCGIVAWSNDI